MASRFLLHNACNTCTASILQSLRRLVRPCHPGTALAQVVCHNDQRDIRQYLPIRPKPVALMRPRPPLSAKEISPVDVSPSALEVPACSSARKS